jgi:dTDP-4-dehydrorhamnose 3,5-epimerase
MEEQKQETIFETSIKGLYKVMRPTFADERGFFHEIFRLNDLEEKMGKEFKICQANHSRSAKGVLRGIHRATWNKLVTAASGKVQAVIVDLRENSKTFGKWESFILGEGGDQFSLFVPSGCGNSFMALSEVADYVYMVDDYWAPGKEIGLLYNDEDLGIKWEIENPIVSEKDQKNITVKEAFPNQFIA